MNLGPLCLATADGIIIDLIKEANIVAQFTVISGAFYTRLSGSIFNRREDYYILRDVLLKKFGLAK